jgi:DNA-binding NarL/FixJ family response regulator
MQISTMIYEDNDVLRESLHNMLTLSDNIFVSASFKNPTNIVSEVKQYQPHVILMDIDMPHVTGIEAVKRVRNIDSHVFIIMLTVFDDDQHVFDAICAGASGYLLKKHIATRLLDAISEVLDGGAPMSPSIARMVISSMQEKKSATDSYQLTSREKEILSSLASGNSYKLIASELEISIDTVRSHIKRIYEKLHVHSQTEAVAKALKEKLV